MMGTYQKHCFACATAWHRERLWILSVHRTFSRVVHVRWTYVCTHRLRWSVVCRVDRMSYLRLVVLNERKTSQIPRYHQERRPTGKMVIDGFTKCFNLWKDSHGEIGKERNPSLYCCQCWKGGNRSSHEMFLFLFMSKSVKETNRDYRSSSNDNNSRVKTKA
jgi:hypothetical protein